VDKIKELKDTLYKLQNEDNKSFVGLMVFLETGVELSKEELDEVYTKFLDNPTVTSFLHPSFIDILDNIKGE
jgi:hypothetical protein